MSIHLNTCTLYRYADTVLVYRRQIDTCTSRCIHVKTGWCRCVELDFSDLKG